MGLWGIYFLSECEYWKIFPKDSQIEKKISNPRASLEDDGKETCLSTAPFLLLCERLGCMCFKVLSLEWLTRATNDPKKVRMHAVSSRDHSLNGGNVLFFYSSWEVLSVEIIRLCSVCISKVVLPSSEF
eukprot:c16992_g1_i1 orf=708-1094(+)